MHLALFSFWIRRIRGHARPCVYEACVTGIKGPGAVFFDAGCNEQAFSPKPWKKLAQFRLVVFEKTQKIWRHQAEG